MTVKKVTQFSNCICIRRCVNQINLTSIWSGKDKATDHQMHTHKNHRNSLFRNGTFTFQLHVISTCSLRVSRPSSLQVIFCPSSCFPIPTFLRNIIIFVWWEREKEREKNSQNIQTHFNPVKCRPSQIFLIKVINSFDSIQVLYLLACMRCEYPRIQLLLKKPFDCSNHVEW